MNKIFTVFLIMPVLLYSQSEWEWQYPYPHGNNFSSIFTVDSLFTVAGCEGGMIIRTSDAGESWETVYIPEKKSSSVKSLCSIANNLIAVLNDSVIIISKDNGKRWELLQHSLNIPVSIIAAYQNRLWAAGLDNSLYISDDIGKTWITAKVDSIEHTDAIFFLNDTLGFISGHKILTYGSKKGHILKTTDGGYTWTWASSEWGAYIKIYFTDKNYGWKFTPGSLKRTTDGGKTWADKKPQSYYSGDRDFIFTDKVNGYFSTSSVIYRTNDAGETWATDFQQKSDWRKKGFLLSAFKDKIFIAAGENGAILKKADKSNWIKNNEYTKYSYTSVHFNDQIGLAAAFNSDTSIYSSIHKSTDSGLNWRKIKAFVPAEIRRVWVLNDSSFLTAGRSIYKSTDGGTTWNKKAESGSYIYSLFFISQTTGWAGGLGGKFFATTDGGDTWALQNLNTLYGILGIYFADTQNGWITGENGIIFKTTNSGEDWVQILPPELSTFISVYFSDGNNGVIAGNGIFKTTDGGSSWINVLRSGEFIQTMQFSNESLGYAAGSFGKVYKTTDGGSTWINQNVITNNKIWDMYITNEKGWICGDGLIMRTSGTMVDVKELVIIPEQNSLLQNYPNPFNPSTTIRYSLGETRRVTIKVYNILGGEVSTLVNEEKPSGNYEVKFDAGNLSSGVYYYQLRTGDYTAVKKMMLIK